MKLRVLALALLLLVVSPVSAPAQTEDVPPDETDLAMLVLDENTVLSSLPEPTVVGETAAAAPPPAAAGVNQGIQFGRPAVLGSSALRVVGVPVTNTSDRPRTFTVTATVKTGGTGVAIAAGAVNDLLPGQTRAATLAGLAGLGPLPTSYESIRVDVDTVLAAQSSKTEAVGKILLGQPTVRTVASVSTVEVEAKNTDATPHSFTVQAAFLQGDQITGIGSGVVNDLAAGQTRTATLALQGSAVGYDRVLLAVETLVK